MTHSPASPVVPSVLAVPTPFVEGWPAKDDERAGVFPLSAVLTERFDTDVHFTAYTCAVERRHTTGSLARADEAGVQMVAAVFDVDGPGHAADEAWWQTELSKLQPLLRDGAFVYRTRGGYRIVCALPEPFALRSAEDAERWTRGYLSCCNYLEQEHDIIADRRCKEWQRLYRAPHATRDGEALNFETHGDPKDLGLWAVVDDAYEEAIDEIPPKNPKNPESFGSPVIAPTASVSTRRDAAAKMLAAAWPAQGRHGAQLALAGALCHDGWSADTALEFLCAVCSAAGNEERPKREKTVRDTYKAHAEGRPIQGWTSLGQYVDGLVLEGARRMLDPDADARREFEALINKRKPEPETIPAATTTRRVRPSERARRLGGTNIVRLKTGFTTVDNSTRGGILLRKLAVIGGAPGAGKTAMLCKLAYNWLSQGIPVGILASDEDADALLIRLGQLHGLERDSLEMGSPEARDALAEWCDSVPLLLADGDEDDATIEAVSRELREFAAGGPSVLLVDSMQTARTGTELSKGADLRTRVNEAVRVLKRAAKVDGHLVFASSELAKAAYRNKAQADNINALSAFKESGDIEYGVSFAMVLVTSSGANDLVEAEIVKNRLGAGKPAFLLKLDHTRANVSETARAEQELRDPLTFLKVEVIETIQKHGALTKNRVYEVIGGRKQDVFKAVNALLDEKKLVEAREGLRKPLPGEGGYEE